MSRARTKEQFKAQREELRNVLTNLRDKLKSVWGTYEALSVTERMTVFNSEKEFEKMLREFDSKTYDAEHRFFSEWQNK